MRVFATNRDGPRAQSCLVGATRLGQGAVVTVVGRRDRGTQSHVGDGAPRAQTGRHAD